MIIEVIQGCDACKRKLTLEQIEANKSVKLAYAESHKGQNLQHVTEVFCSACLPYAHEYWDTKPQVQIEAIQVLNNRIENHRRDFFQKHVLRPLKVAK